MLLRAGTNLFDLTKAINLSRGSARQPDWIDVFLLRLTVRVCGHGDIFVGGLFGGRSAAVHCRTQVHDRRGGEREKGQRSSQISTLRDWALAHSISTGHPPSRPCGSIRLSATPLDGRALGISVYTGTTARSCSRPYRLLSVGKHTPLSIHLGRGRTQDTPNSSFVLCLSSADQVLRAVKRVRCSHASSIFNCAHFPIPEDSFCTPTPS